MMNNVKATFDNFQEFDFLQSWPKANMDIWTGGQRGNGKIFNMDYSQAFLRELEIDQALRQVNVKTLGFLLVVALGTFKSLATFKIGFWREVWTYVDGKVLSLIKFARSRSLVQECQDLLFIG